MRKVHIGSVRYSTCGSDVQIKTNEYHNRKILSFLSSQSSLRTVLLNIIKHGYVVYSI
jgi:hypothetical protein